MRLPARSKITTGGLPAALLLLCTAVTAPAQVTTASELEEQVKQALANDPSNVRVEVERLLREHLDRLRNSPEVPREQYAETSVIFSLLLLGNQRPADEIRPLAQEAVRIYEEASPPVDDARMALALEALAAASSQPDAARLRERSTAIRASLMDRLTEDTPARQTAAQPASGPLQRIDATVSAPKLLVKPEPSYTGEARLARRQGTVLLGVEIGADGTIARVRVLRGLGFGLDEAACRTVRTWLFEPARQFGNPVAVSANVEMNFRLL